MECLWWMYFNSFISSFYDNFNYLHIPLLLNYMNWSNHAVVMTSQHKKTSFSCCKILTRNPVIHHKLQPIIITLNHLSWKVSTYAWSSNKQNNNNIGQRWSLHCSSISQLTREMAKLVTTVTMSCCFWTFQYGISTEEVHRLRSF